MTSTLTQAKRAVNGSTDLDADVDNRGPEHWEQTMGGPSDEEIQRNQERAIQCEDLVSDDRGHRAPQVPVRPRATPGIKPRAQDEYGCYFDEFDF